jgi:endonuclease G, mitochondrial
MTYRWIAIGSLLLAGALAVVAQQSGSSFRPSPPTTKSVLRSSAADRTRLNLAMGMPAPATTDPNNRDAFLIVRPQSAISYSDKKRTPNWISWHINRESLPQDFRFRRQDFFNPDPQLPKTFAKVEHFDYHRDNGFDRGHLCPAADRSLSEEDNRVTFMTTNIVPQAPNNNQLAWERFERHCRDLAKRNEVFIVAGPYGSGGEGMKGYRTEIGRAHVQVPSHTWKIVLALPAGRQNPSDVTPTTTVLAIVTPNNQSVTEDWRKYQVSVAEVERLTGYQFFSHVDPAVAQVLKKAGPTRRVEPSAPVGKSEEKKAKKPQKELKGGLGK